MKVRGTDFVLYEVSDIERSIEFYRDTLGLELELFIADVQWAEFKAEPTTLGLFNPKDFRSEAPEPKTGGASIYLAMEDVNAAIEELKAKGVSIVYGPMETPVCWMAAVLDPDGNVIGMHQRKDGSWG